MTTALLRNYRIEAIDKNHFSHVIERFFDDGDRAERTFHAKYRQDTAKHPSNVVLLADLYRDDEFIDSITL